MENVITEEKVNTYDKIMKDFPFEKVHAYMLLTKWTWYTADRDEANQLQVPSIDQIKETAGSMLFRVMNYDKRNPSDEGASIGQGGFYAYRFKWDGRWFYKLTFEPFRSSNY